MAQERVLLVLVLLVCLAIVSSAPPPGSPIVQTPLGPIQGATDPATGVNLFLGIRYAQAPVGDLRWAAPQAVVPWGNSSVYNASAYGAVCFQVFPSNNVGSSEDCLFLNIFVPPSEESGPSDGLPVRVWIHGGGFTQGSSTEYPGASLAALSGAIVVTLNYRLGNLGFLSLPVLAQEDPLLNWGIQDQRLAMTWVQQNIAAFGGNPQNTLLFGESAGGMSVAIHLVSKQSWGLYHRVILESPAPWYTIDSQAAFAHNTAVLEQETSCSVDDLTCLRNLSASAVVMLPVVNTPVVNGVEGDLSAQPYVLFLEGSFNQDVDVLVGNNANEGTIFVYQSAKTLEVNNTLTNHLLTGGFETLLFPNASDLTSQVWSIYQPIDEDLGNFEALSYFAAEFYITCGTRNLANAVSQYNSDNHTVWRYLFSHTPSYWTVSNVSLTDLNSTHGVELPFVFHESIFGIVLDSQEFLLSDDIVSYWSNFHVYSDPNSQGDYGSTYWPPYIPDQVNSTLFNLNTNFGLYEETWAGRCAQLQAIFYPDSSSSSSN